MRQSPKSSLCSGLKACEPSSGIRESTGVERLSAAPDDPVLALAMKGQYRRLLPRS
ncbi:hypothetical protein [Paenibacillus ihbetae]|uniref:hypothetical protein n=1 Tax=Paenibacillus ihbetae TaxID=1870820 RepID=UPI00130013B4|nr:hypothetical protein [Paenibacillus ihbetae]